MDNTPYREPNGELLFRPAGHGALIENLNEREAAVVFIKNIDNVVPSKFRATTTKYKRVIAGYLVEIQAKVAAMLQKIEAGECTEKELKPMLAYLENELSIHSDKTAEMDKEQLCAYIKAKLNRPIRVCGVVKMKASQAVAHIWLITLTVLIRHKSSNRHKLTRQIPMQWH